MTCSSQVKRWLLFLQPKVAKTQFGIFLDVALILEQWLKSARVQGAIAECGGSRIAFCRVNVWEADKNAFSGFDVYPNLPFEAEQMETFIR
ncbi:hypothetical protein H4N54_03400 [Limnospira fusiformis KN01]|uniref:hypothetical protein n=1 Tax=Limnospira TaxID=2596745 RepID=UPI001F132194|nr:MULTISPECIES: hypothetical protein [Limnospira]ULB46431.1 hypothetical protein H4N54_03400 [Limnospira fusiformis KN01]